jgi:pimeloyl-ACP methyl ester carboxylesterase
VQRGRLDAAAAHGARAIELGRAAGYRSLVATVELLLSRSAFLQATVDLAKARLVEGMKLANEIGRHALQVFGVACFADLLVARGEDAVGRRVFAFVGDQPDLSKVERERVEARLADLPAPGEADAGAPTIALAELARRIVVEADLDHAPLIAALRPPGSTRAGAGRRFGRGTLAERSVSHSPPHRSEADHAPRLPTPPCRPRRTRRRGPAIDPARRCARPRQRARRLPRGVRGGADPDLPAPAGGERGGRLARPRRPHAARHRTSPRRDRLGRGRSGRPRRAHPPVDVALDAQPAPLNPPPFERPDHGNDPRPHRVPPAADTPTTARYARCIEVSKRIRWEIERDVIRDRRFDFRRKFMPDGLSKIEELAFLAPAEKRFLSHIQGRTYANMFALVERFIGAKMLEISQDHWLGDQVALEALVRFTDEELKHQELFRRLERMAAGHAAGYASCRSPNDVAARARQVDLGGARADARHRAVLAGALPLEHRARRRALASCGRTCSCSTGRRSRSTRSSTSSSGGASTRGSRGRARAGRRRPDRARRRRRRHLPVQAEADAAYFLASAGAPFTAPSAAIRDLLLKAYRWQYIVTGVQEPRFADVIRELVTPAQMDRIGAALAPILAHARLRGSDVAFSPKPVARDRRPAALERLLGAPVGRARCRPSDRYEVHAVDLHGHGRRSAWPAGAADARRRGRLAAPLLAAAGSAHVIGHSYGGAVALKLASLQPDRVRSVVVYEPTLFRILVEEGAWGLPARDIRFTADAIRAFVRAGRPAEAARHFVDFWSRRGQYDRMSASRQRGIDERMATVLAHFDALFAEPLTSAALRRLTMPRLFLTGADTVATTRHLGELLRLGVPGAVHETLRGWATWGRSRMPTSSTGASRRFSTAAVGRCRAGRERGGIRARELLRPTARPGDVRRAVLKPRRTTPARAPVPGVTRAERMFQCTLQPQGGRSRAR